MKSLAKQIVLYCATVVIMLMTLAAIAAWHLFKWGYQLTCLLKTGRNTAEVSCRKISRPVDREKDTAPKEDVGSEMVSASEKL